MWPLLFAALATVGLLNRPHPGQDITLLTLPQGDRFRSRADPPSASVSADGRYVAFMSYARLVRADTERNADIYVLDRLTGEVTLESLDADGTPLVGASSHPRLSGDGRLLTFDAAVHDRDGAPVIQIVLRDRTLRTTRWIGRTAGATTGWSREAAISADGSVVVFTSAATDLVPGTDDHGTGLNVYAYTVATGEIRRVSLDSAGRQPGVGRSYAPSVSANGRHVAFVSTAPLAGAEGRHDAGSSSATPHGHVYVRDLDTGVTTRLSQSSRGKPGDAGSWGPAVSGDGRYVAFASTASNLVRGDRNRVADVFLHEMGTGVTTLVSRTARGGFGNGPSSRPAISHDGALVTFQSEASDLACAARCRGGEDVNLVMDVFLFERATGYVHRLSSEEHSGWIEESGGAAMSSDGSVIVFTSRHPIDAADAANDFDLFVREHRRPGD